MPKMEFEITKIDGSKVLCEVIATYHDETLNKDFIVYTDRTFNEEGKLRIYYSLFEMNNNQIKLIDPETTKEKQIGLELIKALLEELKN